MENNDNPIVTTPTGSEMDNQNNGSPSNDNQPGGGVNNSEQPALTPEQISALQEENTRLRGQTSALTKKLTNFMRGNQNGNFNNQGNKEGEDENTQVFRAAFELSEAKLRNELETRIFPLYDGSDPAYASDPQLPGQELARIRQNPWAFASRQSLLHALETGDLQPALLDIEEAISTRVEESGSNNNNKPNGVVKTVNPNPVAPSAPANQAPQGQDLWTMPLDQLEQLNANAVREMTGK